MPYLEKLKGLLSISTSREYVVNDSRELIPKEYLAFIEYFGMGKIADFVWVLSPIAKNMNLNSLVKEQEFRACLDNGAYLSDDRELMDVLKVSSTNLLALTENGDFILGVTDSRIIVIDGRLGEYEIFEMSFTAFVYKLLVKEVYSDILTEAMEGVPVGFVQYLE